MDLIAEKLGEVLKAQNFSAAKEYTDEKGPCVIFIPVVHLFAFAEQGEEPEAGGCAYHAECGY